MSQVAFYIDGELYAIVDTLLVPGIGDSVIIGSETFKVSSLSYVLEYENKSRSARRILRCKIELG